MSGPEGLEISCHLLSHILHLSFPSLSLSLPLHTVGISSRPSHSRQPCGYSNELPSRAGHLLCMVGRWAHSLECWEWLTCQFNHHGTRVTKVLEMKTFWVWCFCWKCPLSLVIELRDGVWSWNILVVLWELHIHWYQSNLKTQIIGLFNLPVSIISPKIMVEKVADNKCQQVITILCERFVCKGIMCMQQPLISFGLRHLWVNPLVWLITAYMSISRGHFGHYSWPT